MSIFRGFGKTQNDGCRDQSSPGLTTYDMAKNMLKAAVQEDSSGNMEVALVLYKQSLDKWFEVLGAERDPVEQEKIKDLIASYMTRAEEVKAILSAAAAVPQTPAVPQTSTVDGTKKTPKGTETAKSTRRPSDLKNYHKTATRKPAVPTRTGAVGTRPQAAPLGTGASKSDEYESQIFSDMLDSSPGVSWTDISGLEYAKRTIQEALIYANMRPDLFQGLRAPPKGVLLYGPPGTGKTMIAKAIATESGFSFFNISASSVTSKYVGEGEKLMRAVFAVARKSQPSVLFFDEIDALLSARKDNEHEASRRLKTEFMVQVDGAGTDSSERILIIGATNTPWDLDEAVIRRFTKRIYIPLPEPQTREALITHLLQKQQAAGSHSVPTGVIRKAVLMTDGYSGSDIAALCKEAAMGPIREIPPSQLMTVRAESIRAISERDFQMASQYIRPSVSAENIKRFERWSDSFGSR